MDKSNVVGTGSGVSGVRGGAGDTLPLGFQPDAILATAASDRLGFSGTYRTGLTDWIRLVQMGRRDAVVSLSTHDGRTGTLWCRGGEIIAAACEGLTGEAAVYRALTWRGGMVSVEFADVSHRREIRMATPALLLGAACRAEAARQGPAGLDNLPGGEPTDETLDMSDGATAATAPRRTPRELARQRALLIGVAGGVLALGLAAGLVGMWRSAGRPLETAANTSLPEVLLRVDADPDYTAIVLDGRQVGVGKLTTAIPRDGRTHDLLYFAPGYISQRTTFRDDPPPVRVTLLRRAVAAIPSGVSGAAVEQLRNLAPAGAAASDGPRTTRRLAKQPGNRRAAMSSDIDSPAGDSPVPKVDVQIIAERRPSVRIIDERQPRIDVIE